MKNRRGLSTVVGAVFAVTALTSTVTYISFSMNTLNQYDNSVITKNQQLSNTNQERLQITSVTVPNGKFNITVADIGNLPVNITKIWVQNTTATDWDYQYLVSSFVAPGSTSTNIGQTIPVIYNPSSAYNVKLVTSRGNAYQFTVNSASQYPLSIQLISTPNIVPSGFATNLLMIVFNNSTEGATVTNVSPNALGIVANSGVTSNCGLPSPPLSKSIPPGATTIFQWSCTLSGDTSSSITYNATLQNGYSHNYGITTVTIGAVQFASESTSSLSASGLGVGNNLVDSVLLFDQNQFSVPYGGFQMYNTAPDNSTNKNGLGTTFLQLDQSPYGASFYTNNGSSTTISSGVWNATLRYVSAPLPTTFSTNQYPDLIYHFQDYVSGKNNAGNSIGPNDNLTIYSNPSWSPTGGVNNTSGYTLDGSSQYMSDNVDPHTQIPSQNGVASTSMWFKTSGSCSGTCTLMRIGSSAKSPFYDIVISSHHLVFKFSDHNNNDNNGGQVDATCTGLETVDDQNGDFVVTEKTGSTSCQMYTDGSIDGSSSPGTACSGGRNGDCASESGTWNIGRDPSSNNNYFGGIIDNFMHWNSYQPTSSQVTDLLHTSYGMNAETVDVNVFETDVNGNCNSGNGGLGGNCQGSGNVIYQTTSAPMPFEDSWGGYSTSRPSANSFWGQANFTTDRLPTVNVTTSQRIEFQIQYVPKSSGQLGMQMIIDNTQLAGTQSELQMPTISAPFLGYLSYDNKNDGSLYISNAGPNVAWVAPGSRAVFYNYDSCTQNCAYAGWIYFSTNNQHWNQWSNTDSFAIPVGTSLELFFTQPNTQPGLDGYQGGTIIPIGYYKMYVYINGYDDSGHTLLNTQYLGVVRVYSQ